MAEVKRSIAFHSSRASDCENLSNHKTLWLAKRGLVTKVNIAGDVTCLLKENNKSKWLSSSYLFIFRSSYLKGKISVDLL